MQKETTQRQYNMPQRSNPESIFFQNIFKFCVCSHEDLLMEINDIIREAIEESVQSIKEKVIEALNISKNGSASFKSSHLRHHLLSDEFISYVIWLEENQNRVNEAQCSAMHDDDSKTKGLYCQLFKSQEKVNRLSSHVRRQSKKKVFCVDALNEDIDTLNRFSGLLINQEAVSEKTFIRYTIEHVPRYPSESNKEKKRRAVIFVLLKKVLTSSVAADGSPNFDSCLFVSKIDWREVFYDVHGGKIECDVFADGECSPQYAEFVESVHAKFEELRDLVKGNYKEGKKEGTLSKEEKIGDILYEIYKKLKDYSGAFESEYGSKYLSPSPDTKADDADVKPDDVSEKQDDLDTKPDDVNEKPDNAQYKYDSIIFTHITNFMRWIGVPLGNSQDFLDSIQRITDTIREDLVAKINNSFSLEEFKRGRKDCCIKSLFLWEDNTDLLYKLLEAIHLIFGEGQKKGDGNNG